MTAKSPIRLIVGLANPGLEYASTRHNVGAWFVQNIADSKQATLRMEAKFHGLSARVTIASQPTHLLIPTTYMNRSGQAIAAIVRFYKIQANEILIAHDDLDLPVGRIKLKTGGGHGGHNGLRDTFTHLGSQNFHRLRVGIDKPTDRTQTIDYVLKPPSKLEKQQIEASLNIALTQLPDIVTGNLAKAMQAINTL